MTHPNLSTCTKCGVEFVPDTNTTGRWCSRACYEESRRVPFVEGYWGRVDKQSSLYGCWLYTGPLDKDGYGIYRLQRAHRIAWELTNGPIPEGMKVCHNCPGGDNTACCNPAHCFLGTTADNNRDMHEKGRHPHGDNHPSRLRPETRPRGSAHGRAKLTEQQVTAIKELSASGVTGVALAAQFGVSPSAICLILQGKNWAHLR